MCQYVDSKEIAEGEKKNISISVKVMTHVITTMMAITEKV
jgi:hypothetical protein